MGLKLNSHVVSSLVFGVCIHSCVAASGDAYTVESGYLSIEGGQARIYEQAETIIVGKDYTPFGYTITSKVGGNFRQKPVVIIPKPKTYEGEKPISIDFMDRTMKLDFPETHCQRHCYGMLEASTSDPEGLYRVNVYVNGVLLETIVFDVKHDQFE